MSISTPQPAATAPRSMRDELQAMADGIKARNQAQLPSQPVRQPATPAPQPSMEAYRAALAAHDWSFEYSDDHGVWCKGRNSLAALRSMQRQLDSDYAVWNEFAPADFQRATAEVAL